MTNTFTAVAVIGGFTATTLGFASAAAAAPSGFGNAQDTIYALQSQGFNVILNGAAVYPLSGCKVTVCQGGCRRPDESMFADPSDGRVARRRFNRSPIHPDRH